MTLESEQKDGWPSKTKKNNKIKGLKQVAPAHDMRMFFFLLENENKFETVALTASSRQLSLAFATSMM